MNETLHRAIVIEAEKYNMNSVNGFSLRKKIEGNIEAHFEKSNSISYQLLDSIVEGLI